MTVVLDLIINQQLKPPDQASIPVRLAGPPLSRPLLQPHHQPTTVSAPRLLLSPALGSSLSVAAPVQRTSSQTTPRAEAAMPSLLGLGAMGRAGTIFI